MYSLISFWEKESFLNYDYIIVGSGIVGLFTAYNLRKKFPESSICVLERGLLPSGASTRNAGFACIGSLAEIVSDISILGEEKALDLVQMRYEGLQKLRTIIGDKNMDFNACGGLELLQLEEENIIRHIYPINEKLRNRFISSDVFHLKNSVIAQHRFNTNKFKFAIECNTDGHIHTGKLMRALIKLCYENNIEIKTGCSVHNIESNTNNVALRVNDCLRNEITLKAQHIFICTNAFTDLLFPKMDTKPARGQVLITKPFDKVPFIGTFHFDEGYYYFRNVENRILLGGARNADFEGETKHSFEKNEIVFNRLIYVLRNDILPNQSFEIEQMWTGIMCFGSEKFPIIQTKDERIHFGVRMSGMGVALSATIGEKLSQLV